MELSEIRLVEVEMSLNTHINTLQFSVKTFSCSSHALLGSIFVQFANVGYRTCFCQLPINTI